MTTKHSILSKYHEQNACTSKSMFVILHLPNEMPTEYHKFVPISYGSKTSILLTGKSHRTDDALRDYSPDVRQCYFEGEKKLKFFKAYSKAHCEFECVANDTLEECVCVPFWYPRSKLTRVCGLSEMECIDKVNYRHRILGYPSCDCYQPCNSLTYEMAASPTIYFNFYLPK